MNVQDAKKMVSVAENLANEREKCFDLFKKTNDKKWNGLARKLMNLRGKIIDHTETLGVKWYWSESSVKDKNIGTGLLLAEFEGVELTGNITVIA